MARRSALARVTGQQVREWVQALALALVWEPATALGPGREQAREPVQVLASAWVRPRCRETAR